MRKSYKYRIYPTKEQANKLQWVLDRCREIYNAALQERKEAYKYAGKSISCYDQFGDLPAIREVRPEYNDIPIIILRDVLQRVDRAYKAFFRRVKAGEKPGYPRFQGRNRYDSFTYPQLNCFSLTQDNKLCLSKIGAIKVKMHRTIEGKIKTCTIKREGEHWYVVFSCEIKQETVYHPSGESVGIDLGLLHFATLSTGETIENPRYYRKAEKRLVRLQQALSRKKRGSNRRKKAVQAVAKSHRKIRNQRKDRLHKESRKLVNKYQTIVFEDLPSAFMSKRPKSKQDENGKYLPNGASAKAGLNKSIRDAGWSQFVTYCAYKAEWAGGRVLTINPKYTSQICSGCGSVVKKDLSERWHNCECGCSLDRDHNAAINILRLGQSQLCKE